MKALIIICNLLMYQGSFALAEETNYEKGKVISNTTKRTVKKAVHRV